MAPRANVAGSAPGDREVIVASNRGPISFARDDAGELCARRDGGPVSAWSGPTPDPQTTTLWVCAALSDADRIAARAVPGGRLDPGQLDRGRRAQDQTPVRMLDIEALTFHRAYNGIANSVLWFLHHLLFDTARAPVFDDRFRREWAAYVDYNAAFAEAITEEAAPGGRVLFQDYHLSLAPQLVRERRPDLAIAHFSHTPWAPPDYFRILPDDVGVALLEGILAADHVGFPTSRWAEAFLDCCETRLGASIDREAGTIEYAGRRTALAVHPLGVDAEYLQERCARPDVAARTRSLRSLVGGRRLVLRVDRTELSKNTVRGLTAYRDFLRRHPEWQGRVVHLAVVYPSRDDLPEYREYIAAVQRIAQQIIDEFASPDWDPLVLATDDDPARSLAAYRMAHVVVVNPVRAGMNRVAKEAVVASDDGCALILSREAGAADELGADALTVNPYDVDATADTFYRALAMTAPERQSRCSRMAERAALNPPRQWFADQLAALDRVGAHPDHDGAHPDHDGARPDHDHEDDASPVDRQVS